MQRREVSDTVVEGYQLMPQLGTTPQRSYSVNRNVITKAPAVSHVLDPLRYENEPNSPRVCQMRGAF